MRVLTLVPRDSIGFYGTAHQTAGLGCAGLRQGKDGADGTFYDGTVATNCREMTIYDADERFWMLIRPTAGFFTIVNSAFTAILCPLGLARGGTGCGYICALASFGVQYR